LDNRRKERRIPAIGWMDKCSREPSSGGGKGREAGYDDLVKGNEMGLVKGLDRKHRNFRV